MPKSNANSISHPSFANKVLAWQQQHGRHDLPWQQPATPYRVLVSEIMLQQTQVTTVIPYFQRWMQAFPTLSALANANENEVMALWQGLGYYSRARNLQKAATYLNEQHDGEFPNDLEGLLAIPGVGRYTAGAIRAFAYDSYGPIVDGNVRRLFCRLFAIEGQATTSAVTKQLWRYAEQLTPNENNRRFAQGLLDLGATLCKPRNPECERCPFNDQCEAFQQNRINELPTPKLKKVIPEKSGHFLWLPHNEQVTLIKRPSNGIWASLWCLPEIENAPEDATLIASFKHTFSHYKLNAKVWQPQGSANLGTAVANSKPDEHAVAEPAPGAEQVLVDTSTLESYGLPAPISKLVRKLLA